MKKIIAPVILSIVVAMLLVSCKSTPIRNVEESTFVAKPNINLTQIKQAIIRACIKSGWKVKSSNNNTVIAAYSYKRNKFGAVVKISFDHDSYDIRHIKSHNLKYSEYKEKEQSASGFWNESQEMFSEYNPFKKGEQQVDPKSATIHKIYNSWIVDLEQKINHEINSIHLYKASPIVTKTNITSKKTLVKKPYQCNDEPELAISGLATITTKSVNIRNGAGTECEVIGLVTQADNFSLLGRKNNWYYISLKQNQHAWIYAPLVKEVSDEPLTIEEPTPPTPTPDEPVIPTKSISIAVIHFKTLNKEAQNISLGELVSETFTSALVNSHNFKIIEREQLDKVVKEMEMNQTGFIETTDAVEIGKMLHADAIITGSVALLDNQIQLNARIIEIESAYVISAETKTTTYTLSNITKIANEIVAKLSKKLLTNTRQ